MAQSVATTFSGFPDDFVDPKDKLEKEWMLQYSNAVINNPNGIMPDSSFYMNVAKRAEVKSWAQGRQNMNEFKKTPMGQDIQNESWMASDFTPIAVIPKIREMMAAQILEREFDIQAYAVDETSLKEEDAEFAKMKVKVLARNIAKGTSLQDNPAIKKQVGEPEDLEALEISKEFGFKSTLTMSTEDVLSMVLQQNDWEAKRQKNVESLMDAGIAGYDVWIDERNNVRFEETGTSQLVVSFCKKDDFSDAVYIGHIEPVMVADLAKYFDKDEIETICRKSLGLYGNPSIYSNNNISPFKVMVMNINLLSFDTSVYKSEINSKNNPDVLKVGFEYANEKYYKPKEGATTKFSKVVTKNVYKFSRVLGTEFIYDYGLKENQGRKQSKWWDVKFDKLVQAWNKNEMSWVGFTERLIPFAKQYQKIWIQMQNISAKMVPYIMNVNMSALESVLWGASADAGGEKWTPNKIMEFIYQNYAAVFRSDDLTDNQKPGFAPVTFAQTPQMTIIAEYIGQLQFIISQMYEISGLNQAVAGNPNPKTLTTGLNLQQQATNNALYLISKADERLMLNLCEAIFLKVQIAVKRGDVSGYVRALGSQTVKFLQISPEISNREYAIFLKDAPTKEQRMELFQEVNLKESQGLLNLADRIVISETRIIKKAWRYLSYAIRKKEEENHQRQLEIQQAQTQGNAQAAIALEQAKQKTIKLQGQISLQIESVKGQWMYNTEMMKKGSDLNEANVQANAKVLGHKIDASAKESAKLLSA